VNAGNRLPEQAVGQQGSAAAMIRYAYAFLTYLVLPAYALYWVLRGTANASYRERLGQRFGFGIPRMSEGCIWVHAVSFGEVQASLPLVRSLRARFPDRSVLFTTVTPTGASRARSLFGDDVAHCYLPFETPGAVRRFFEAANPRLALIMETEIWPNLYHACGRRSVPLVMVSARISPGSERRYRLLRPLFRRALANGILIAAQSRADAQRFLDLGAEPDYVHVMGNLKFDIELPEDLGVRGAKFSHEWFRDRPAWIAASTHEGEEQTLLAAHRQVVEHVPDALLVLVPRHPERFAQVESLVRKERFSCITRTSQQACKSDTAVFLGDTMGELPLLYAASDVAFVGGTLAPVGGHNLLEPGALGLPIVTGPWLFNTQEIADMFAQAGAATRVQDADSLAHELRRLLTDRVAAERMGEEAKRLVAENRGALERLHELLEPHTSGLLSA